MKEQSATNFTVDISLAVRSHMSPVYIEKPSCSERYFICVTKDKKTCMFYSLLLIPIKLSIKNTVYNRHTPKVEVICMRLCHLQRS